LTFRTAADDVVDVPVIGKFVRRSELEAAYDRLVKVHGAVGPSSSLFSVACPLGVDEKRSLFFQEAKAGRDLAALLNQENFQDLLYQTGAIHRHIHRLEVSDVPQWDSGASVQSLNTQVDWISFCRPDQTLLLNPVRDLLLSSIPRIDPDQYTFCHGDFRCPHVVKENDCWSVVDFDDSRQADPYQEMARLIAFLKYDVPMFRDSLASSQPGGVELLKEAEEAYLEGYEEAARQVLDRKRLLWYRIYCEIHYLARMIQRDLVHPVLCERMIGLIHSLNERLRKEAHQVCCGHDQTRRINENPVSVS
jgi:aminoglycoside phosphotransferase